MNEIKFEKRRDFAPHLSAELKLSPRSVNCAIELLKAGNTVPFIARYRKEATGDLDEVQIRSIEERLQYLEELEDRRATVFDSIASQGKLTDELAQQIITCDSKTKLEDLYLPFKPKRRTRAMIAREKGLEPLALLILEQPEQGSLDQALMFVNAELEVPDVASALKGARDIVSELIAENSDIRSFIREEFEKKGTVFSKRLDEVQGPTKFEQYYDFNEAVATIPSHRFLAIARGERENILRMSIEMDFAPSVQFMRETMGVKDQSPFARELEAAIDDASKRLLAPSIKTDVLVKLKMNADRQAIDVFAQNLRNILLSAPFGAKTVIGIDPGLRTGCKCAVVQDTGKFLDNITIYLHGSSDALERSKRDLLSLIKKYNPIAIAVGNGTGGRETEALVKTLLTESDINDVFVVAVSESGASVYSASQLARDEFPDLDLTIKGAISIARRLQDPLAELVKVEPKAMGVGQYQHDVYQPLLERKLGEVVESCVNQVGVELNTASAPLLSYVAGIGPMLAKSIVLFREQYGPFRSRMQLKDVSGLGPKTFEQAAGFLRVHDGVHPLDASAVHPERYATVEAIAKDLQVDIGALIGNDKAIERIDIKKYISDDLGALTLKDIVDELKKPGRDPRAQFEKPAFRDDVNAIGDLKKGMILEGIVTNVTAFGAFVDIGVHQDGLVHVSQLSQQFVRDPSTIVSTGDKLKVEVLDVDIVRKRISLTACIGKKTAPPTSSSKSSSEKRPAKSANATLGSLASFARFGKN